MSGSKSLTFYAIESDFLSVACKLVEKCYSVKENVLFLCENEEEIAFYNSKLWTFSRLAFIPSGNRNSISIEDAPLCHTWFSTDIVFYNEPKCLVHNGLNLANYPGFEKFEKIVDIFPNALLENAKKRYNIYKEAGFTSGKLWLQTNTGWKAGDL